MIVWNSVKRAYKNTIRGVFQFTQSITSEAPPTQQSDGLSVAGLITNVGLSLRGSIMPNSEAIKGEIIFGFAIGGIISNDGITADGSMNNLGQTVEGRV